MFEGENSVDGGSQLAQCGGHDRYLVIARVRMKPQKEDMPDG